MSKKSAAQSLLGEVRPVNVRNAAVASFLSFFVFAGSFVSADSTIHFIFGESPLHSIAQASDSVVIPLRPSPTTAPTLTWEQQVAKDGAARNPKRGCANADADCNGTITRDEWKAYIEKYRWYEEVRSRCRQSPERCTEIPRPPSFSLQLLNMSNASYLKYLQTTSGVGTGDFSGGPDKIGI